MRKKQKLIPLKSVEEIPEHMTETEAAEFYDTHSLGELWDQLVPVEEEFTFAPLSPKKRLSVTLRKDMIDRLKMVAGAKGWPLGTVVWLWLRQRLMKEEARMAIAEAQPRHAVTKEQMIRALESLPEDATVEDAIDCLVLLGKVAHGLAAADAGQKVSQEEARRRASQWFK